MDKVRKALKKLTGKEMQAFKDILTKVQKADLSGLDVKKLKARDNIYRIRKGKLRIILRKDKSGKFFVLTLERRSDTTYK